VKIFQLQDIVESLQEQANRVAASLEFFPAIPSLLIVQGVSSNRVVPHVINHLVSH